MTAARSIQAPRRASILPRKSPKEGFKPRPWQTKALGEIEAALASHKRVLLTAPTGAGKTEVYAAVIGVRVRKGGRIIVIAHTRNLTGQLGERFEKRLPKNVNITVGNASDPTTWNRTADGEEIHVQVWTIQGITSAIRRGLEIPQVSMVVFDEAHRSEAKSYTQVSEYFAHAKVFGATATPERTDRKHLPFDFMVRGPSTREACQQGIIMAPSVYAPERGLVPDMSGVSLERGDFPQREVAKRVKDKILVGGIVDHWLKLAKGTRTIAFSVDVEHSKMICAQFNAAGISARHVDGTTDSAEAERTLKDFIAGKFTVLCNCAMYMEGTDISKVDTVILARPTCSRSIFMQTCGRAMRIKKNKRTPLILDHAGNTYRHGHPVAYIAPGLDDIIPPYNRNALATVRRCKCGAMLEIGEACVCGEPEVPEIVNVEGELVEVKDERRVDTCFCGCKNRPNAARAFSPSVVRGRAGWPWMCIAAGHSAGQYRKRNPSATFEEFARWFLEMSARSVKECMGCGRQLSETARKLTLTKDGPSTHCPSCSKRRRAFQADPVGCKSLSEYIRLTGLCSGCGCVCSKHNWHAHVRSGRPGFWKCRDCRVKEGSFRKFVEAAQ